MAGIPAYTAAKGGLEALTRQLAAEYAEHGIRANTLVLGSISVPRNADLHSDDAMAQALRSARMTYDPGRPADVAAAVAFLAGDEARFITGATLNVDGGLLAKAPVLRVAQRATRNLGPATAAAEGAVNRWTSPSASSFPASSPAYVEGPADIPALAVEFERLGFDDVMDGEHILYAAQMNHPGGAGNFEHSRVEQHSDRWDTLVMFAAIAARTTRLRLVSGIILAAAHTYAVLARQAATLDSISGGRFTLGVGGGWNAAEFAQLGIAPAERAARSEETIRACRELWSPGLSSFAGRWITFTDVICEPAPATAGGVPVWWGGDARSHAGRAPGGDARRGLAVARGGRLRRDRPVDRVDPRRPASATAATRRRSASAPR